MPIIGLSAFIRPELKNEYLIAGMDEFLTKPTEKKKIYETIQKWTRSTPENTELKQASTGASHQPTPFWEKPSIESPSAQHTLSTSKIRKNL